MSATLTPPVPLAAPPAIAPAVPSPMPNLYRFTVEQCQAMLAAGIFGDKAPVELIDGLLLVKDMENPPHIAFADLLRAILGAVIPVGWHARWDHPIQLAGSMPEPDGAVVRGTVRDYLRRLPTAADTGLVVEVADSSLARDRTEKLAMYAAARIPTYWILNVPDQVLEVRTGPRGTGATADYADAQILGPTQSVAFVLDGVTVGPIAVSDLLP